jgi:ribonuclease Z
MKVIFLGTNAWYDTETGNTPCILIDSKNYYVVLDAGNGSYKLDQYIKDDRPIYVFLSHLHLDHIEGFHTYDKFNFSQTIKIHVPDGQTELLKSIINHPFAKPFKDKNCKFEFFDIKEGKNDLPIRYDAFHMNHADYNLGYRFYIDNKIICYSGDTGIMENSVKLAKNADLLIHECSNLSGMTTPKWGHANPEEVASLAKEANVKNLALVHFNPVFYSTLKIRKEAEEIAKNIFPNTIAATDGLELII